MKKDFDYEGQDSASISRDRPISETPSRILHESMSYIQKARSVETPAPRLTGTVPASIDDSFPANVERSGDVPAGYKRTKAGVIPEEWEACTIGEVTNIGTGGTPKTGNTNYWNGAIPWCVPTDVTGTPGKYLFATERRISAAGLANSAASLLPAGSLLLCTRATIGDVRIATIPICVNQGFKPLVCKNGIDNEFLYYVVLTLKSQMLERASGSTFQEIGKSALSTIPFPVPAPAEQRAIAEALSDVDCLLESLDALVAKKRAIKNATMQQLLTGMTRLPGFSGKWTITNFARDSVLKARIGWQGLTTAEYLSSGKYYLVTGTDFDDGQIEWGRCCYVTRSRYLQDKHIQLKLDDVLLTKDGTIGKVGYVAHLPGPATLNSGVFVIRPVNHKWSPLYMFYVLTSGIFRDFLKRLAAGSTISHLYQKDFVGFEFSAPEMDEQVTIATVLSEMDSEITKLEQRREKARAIKKGMMQQLLTGQVRLI